MRLALSAGLLGLSALLATASPVPVPAEGASDSSSTTAAAGAVFPNDGFPDPNAQQLKGIEKAAFGTLPNTDPPAKLSDEGKTNLQLIALNEIFEVAFFNSLLKNVTSKAPGYQVDDYDYTVATLKAIVAQEELHALNANGALEHFGVKAVKPCTKYIFPTTNFKDAIKLAGTFTSVVLGTLQDVTKKFADNGDSGLTATVGSVIGQEGEQEGWFRVLQGQIPNELPFLTASVRDFAFTAIQSFAAPGSCPSVKDIDLKTYKPLTVVAPPGPKTAPVKFTIAAKDYDKNSKYYVTFINQQNKPITQQATGITVANGAATLTVSFPYDKYLLNGLTIASVACNEAGPYASADDVAKDAIFGPGLIIVQPKTT